MTAEFVSFFLENDVYIVNGSIEYYHKFEIQSMNVEISFSFNLVVVWHFKSASDVMWILLAYSNYLSGFLSNRNHSNNCGMDLLGIFRVQEKFGLFQSVSWIIPLLML